MKKDKSYCFRGCAVVFALFIILIMALFAIVNPGVGTCEITLTNTTGYAVTDLRLAVSRSEIELGELAPHAATSAVFKVTQDTGYRISYAMENFAPVVTNVGYSTRGINAFVRINFLTNGNITYYGKHKLIDHPETPKDVAEP
jgi:hypothetical protein